MERQEYPTMLATLQPSQAVTVLNERTKHIVKTNEDVANWLLERKKAEEVYAQALKKLAKRTPPDAGSDLGVFDIPWRNLLKATDAAADSHATLAKRIETDVERPLRDFGTANRVMQQLSTVTGNLQAMAKDYDTAQKQNEKAKGKAGNKIATANSQLEGAASQWESQAPYVFENLQAADEGRWNHLRDVLTQLQTHEVDTAQRVGAAAEKCLNTLLNVETADEIKTFAIRNTGQGGVISPPASSRQTIERRGSRDPTRSTPSLGPPLVERASNGNTEVSDAASQRSESVQEDKKSRLGGLRRLGTVMGRRKSVIPKSTPSRGRGASLSSIADEEPDRLQSSSGGDLDPVTAQDSNGPPRTFSGISESLARPDAERDVNAAGPAGTSSDLPQLQLPLQPTMQLSASHVPDPEIVPPPGPPPAQFSALQSSVISAPQSTPIPEIQSGPYQFNDANGATTDGYSVPPTVLDPISQAQQDAASALEGQPYKLDIRNAPIADENTDAQAAMASVASSLRAQQVAPRRSGTTRGRRDVRNTVFMPSPLPENETATTSTPAAASPLATAFGASSPSMTNLSAVSPSLQRQLVSEDAAAGASDSQSIRSGHTSLASTTAVIKHPELNGPGLNTSIVETVSAWFGPGGTLTRAIVIGELAFAHNAADPSTSAAQTASIRLDNFPILEKVAPNPSFVHQPAADRPGEYSVSLAALGVSTRPQVAFKYQIHLPETQLGTHAPLLLAPVWKVEARQTSVIVSYALHPGYAGAALSGSTTLTNVALVVHLEGSARASSCQSKPAGTFAKDRNLIYWKFDSLTLTKGAPAEKLLARFVTDGGEAKQGRVEARWELVSGSSVGSGLGVSAAEASGASDPFADESAAGQFKELAPVRKLISGTYQAS